MLAFRGRALLLTQGGLNKACNIMGVSACEVMTLIEVETCGVGFLPDSRPAILFERHIFSKRTGRKHDITNPDISNIKPGGYGGYGAPQYQRLEKALALDEQEALNSASWGLGQIMGFNYCNAGYTSVESMVRDFCDSEDAQLLAVANFVKRARLHVALQKRDWAYFARGYNGPDFAKNKYDLRLEAAHNLYSSRAEPNCFVRAQQINLAYMGYYKGKIDGLDGPKTRAALQMAQNDGRVPLAQNDGRVPWERLI